MFILINLVLKSYLSNSPSCIEAFLTKGLNDCNTYYVVAASMLTFGAFHFVYSINLLTDKVGVVTASVAPFYAPGQLNIINLA